VDKLWELKDLASRLLSRYGNKVMLRYLYWVVCGCVARLFEGKRDEEAGGCSAVSGDDFYPRSTCNGYCLITE